MKEQSRLDVRKYSFSQRTINVCNKLSNDCDHASGINMLKTRIDKYLVRAGYTWNSMSGFSIRKGLPRPLPSGVCLNGNLVNPR